MPCFCPSFIRVYLLVLDLLMCFVLVFDFCFGLFVCVCSSFLVFSGRGVRDNFSIV